MTFTGCSRPMFIQVVGLARLSSLTRRASGVVAGGLITPSSCSLSWAMTDTGSLLLPTFRARYMVVPAGTTTARPFPDRLVTLVMGMPTVAFIRLTLR